MNTYCELCGSVEHNNDMVDVCKEIDRLRNALAAEHEISLSYHRMNLELATRNVKLKDIILAQTKKIAAMEKE